MSILNNNDSSENVKNYEEKDIITAESEPIREKIESEVRNRTSNSIRRPAGDEGEDNRRGPEDIGTEPERVYATKSGRRSDEYDDGRRKKGTSKRGFASMKEEEQREIASMGGKAAHEYGVAHEFTPEEAREAGRKGGEKTLQKRGREFYREIGRLGGKASHGGRRSTNKEEPKDSKIDKTDANMDRAGNIEERTYES